MKDTKRLALAAVAASFLAAGGLRAAEPDRVLLQVKPGENPNALSFEKHADVTINGKSVNGRFTLDQNSAPVEKELDLRRLKVGEAVKVDAVFMNSDGSQPASCTETWPTTAPNSVGCGPIEVLYNPGDNSCSVVCR